MPIKIAERLHPFSHCPGSYCPLPGSNLRIQIFPALLVVHDLTHSEPIWMAEIPVPLRAPIHQFTLELDLEKGCIRVWGESQDGYFRYQIFHTNDPHTLSIQIDKGLTSWSPVALKQHQGFKIANSQPFPSIFTERLSLGSQKSQDWDLIKRRADLKEILPVWLRLGELMGTREFSYDGTGALLKICQEASKLEVYQALLNCFQASFMGILSPSLWDKHYQGFDLKEPSGSSSPLALLTEGAKFIRSLFLRTVDHEISILPLLPPQFHCGRFLHVSCDALGHVDLEWASKRIRQMDFHAAVTDSVQFRFAKEIDCFRLNGEMHSADQPIQVEQGKVYHFDRFQKS